MSIIGVLLGLGGLIPFLGTSIGLWVTDDEDLLRIGLLYGATIVSFLGGVYWGHALGAPAGIGGGRLVAAVLPSLIAWGATLSPPLAGPPLLLLGILGTWGFEQRAALRSALPTWYASLRHVLTFVVSGCLVADAIWVWLRW